MGAVVDAVNALSPQRERVFFAAPDFQSDHVLFASRLKARLWRLNSVSQTTDETRRARSRVCRDEYGRTADSKQCNLASVGHPNVKGAKLYYQALAKFL